MKQLSLLLFGLLWTIAIALQGQAPTDTDTVSTANQPQRQSGLKQLFLPFLGKEAQLSPDKLRERAQPELGLFFYPTTLFVNQFTMGGEIKLGFRTAMRAVVGYSSAEKSRTYDVANMSGGYLEAQFRYYPMVYAMKGIYFMGFSYAKLMDYQMNIQRSGNLGFDSDIATSYDLSALQQAYGTSDFPVLDGSAQAFGVGLGAGANIMFTDRIAFDLFVGTAYQAANIGGASRQFFTDNHPLLSSALINYNTGIKAHLSVALGVLFY
jgi:hypothetical protein